MCDLSSFLLGRLSVVSKSSGVKIVYPAGQSTDKIESQTATVLNGRAAALPFKTNTQSYFASSRGKKYYSSGCAAGKSIKVENRVYFASKAEAEKAGYELSSSCR